MDEEAGSRAKVGIQVGTRDVEKSLGSRLSSSTSRSPRVTLIEESETRENLRKGVVVG